MTTTLTATFRFGIPDFLSDPWHEDFATLIHHIDRVLAQLILLEGIEPWANDTDYFVGNIVLDDVTGIMYISTTDHHSSPVLSFEDERAANPGRWNSAADLPQNRGNWVTGETYIPGDFVVESGRYAVCYVGHVAGIFNDDVADGNWAILIDVSTLGVSINAESEGSIAAAASTEIGDESPTRLLVTGSATINDFGNVPNQYKILRYAGVCTITNSPVIVIPGGDDRVTDAGAIQMVTSDATGAWRELFYTPGSGTIVSLPIASTILQGIVELATVAEAQAGVDTTRAITADGLAAAVSDGVALAVNTIRNGVGASLDTLSEIATALSLLAPLASPTFTGAPSLPAGATGVTAGAGDNDTTLATTAFVQQEIASDIAALNTILHVQDQQTSGTAGGAVNSTGTWLTKPINTVVLNEIASSSLGSNQITLPAGTYYIEADASFYQVGNVRMALYNVTDTAFTLVGINCADNDTAGGNNASIRGKFTIAGAKVFELQFITSHAQAVNGMGSAISAGTEVYLDAVIRKL